MEINIEKIMDEIRADIKAKGYTNDMLSFNEVSSIKVVDGSFSREEYDTALNYLNNSYNVVSIRPLTGNPLFVFIKRIIRKLAKFYVEPIVASQNEYNAFNVRVLNALSEKVLNNDNVTTSELLKRIEMLELQVKTISSENKELKEKFAQNKS